VVFWCRKSWQNSNRVTPNRDAKCRWGRLNAGAVAENWRLLMRSVVNFVRSQFITLSDAFTLCVCSAARSPWCSALRRFVSDRWSLLYLAYLQLGIKRRAPLQLLTGTCCHLACYCSCHEVIIPKFQTKFWFFYQKPNRTDSVVFGELNRKSKNHFRRSLVCTVSCYHVLYACILICILMLRWCWLVIYRV